MKNALKDQLFSKSWEINSKEVVNFKIHHTHNVFSSHQILDDLSSTNRVFIAIDRNVSDIYIEKLRKIEKDSPKKYFIHKLPPDEMNKNFETTLDLIKFLDKNKLKRVSEPLIAIGGGVTLDIASFAASIYRRGVPIIKIPTNLLSIVDACVGVKTGINLGIMRNRIGTYYPPSKVLVDKNFLNTCPSRHISNGLGEIFKIALIKSKDLFSALDFYCETVGLQEKLCKGPLASKIINESITLMLEELEPNLWEKNLQRCVDFGHSFSPLIELKNIDELLHGEAVALDCLFSSCLSNILGYLDYEELCKCYKLAKNLGLKTLHKDFTKKSLILESIEQTKAHRNGDLNLPLPNCIGKYIFINDLNEEQLSNTIDLFINMS